MSDCSDKQLNYLYYYKIIWFQMSWNMVDTAIDYFVMYYMGCNDSWETKT